MLVYPLLLEPILLPKIWGGRNLARLFERTLPEGVCAVGVGPEAGRTLRDLVADWGERLVGAASLAEGRFPLLIKLLDAEDVLSVQVHPDEEACEQLGGDARVKHEAWYIVEARNGAAIYAGLRPGVTREQFAAAVADGTVADTLERIPVRAGDCYYLPSGTVHALGAGVVVAEIQTPSDTTYRVFDWDRLDDDGKPRTLHIEQAMMCIHFGAPPPSQQPRQHESDPWTTTTRLVTCPRFVIDKVRATEGFEQRLDIDQMGVWVVLSGRGQFRTTGLDEPIDIQAGRSLIIPAGVDETVFAAETDCTWLAAAVPV